MPAAAAPRRRRLYLVRHGHVSYFDADGQPLNPKHVALSPLGISQVQSLAAVLKAVRIDRILCSDLERARQTAQLLVEQSGAGIVPQPEPGLREIRAGRLREVPADRLEAELGYAYDRAVNEDAAFVGGENFADFERRILAVLQGLIAEPDWDSALMVSHDAVNRVLLCWAAGADRSAMAAFEQDMACLNIVDIDCADGKVVRRLIRTFNFTAYDAVKSGIGPTVMEQVLHAYRAGMK